MTHELILINEREEALQRLEDRLGRLPNVDPDELREMVVRAGSSSGAGLPDRPRYNDVAGSAFLYAHLFDVLSEAVVAQQQRIEELERALAKPAKAPAKK